MAVRLIKELCKKNKPFLIFDYKRNYRDLLKHPDFKDQEIIIFTVGRNNVVPFYFNPKQAPEGVEDYVWIKQLAQLIEKVYLLGPGANDVFMESAGMDTFKEMQEKVLNIIARILSAKKRSFLEAVEKLEKALEDRIILIRREHALIVLQQEPYMKFLKRK